LHDSITGGRGEEWKTKARRTKYVCGREDGIEGEEES